MTSHNPTPLKRYLCIPKGWSEGILGSYDTIEELSEMVDRYMYIVGKEDFTYYVLDLCNTGYKEDE
jgi:hypothetical protein